MIQAKMRVSLKKFLKLPKTFRTEVLSQVYPIDFAKWIKIERDNSKTKLDARILREKVCKDNLRKFLVPMRRCLPNEFRTLLKKFTAWCKTCCQPFYPEHLEDHGIRRVRVEELFEDLGVIESELEADLEDGAEKPKRIDVLSAFSDHFKGILVEVDRVLQEHAEVFCN